ncbi:hypothetical protein I4U23_016945 [Adineta vaga]|nr:hypothetical protein I4U23_016945 [Adineta vaga]
MFESTIEESITYRRLGNDGAFGMNSDYEPTITVIVHWTPEFGMAYQQFINSAMGGMMGGFPMGGMGSMNSYGPYGSGM